MTIIVDGICSNCGAKAVFGEEIEGEWSCTGCFACEVIVTVVENVQIDDREGIWNT